MSVEKTDLELSLAQSALEEAAEFFRTRAAPPNAAGISKAAEDPHLILRFGQLQTRLHAAQGLLAKARRLAAAGDHTTAHVAALEARAFVTDLTAEIISQAITWGAPLTPRPQQPPSSSTSPGSVAPAPNANSWRYHDAGNYYLKGVAPQHSEAELAP